MTKIKPCTCKHVWQDRVYGLGRRVMNAWKEGWRCTVCNKEYKE